MPRRKKTKLSPVTADAKRKRLARKRERETRLNTERCLNTEKCLNTDRYLSTERIWLNSKGTYSLTKDVNTDGAIHVSCDPLYVPVQKLEIKTEESTENAHHKRYDSENFHKIDIQSLNYLNLNKFTCNLCSLSFKSNKALSKHKRKHLNVVNKCGEYILDFEGQKEDPSKVASIKQTVRPPCIICVKAFSNIYNLKRHIRNYHSDFDVEELATLGCKKFGAECKQCIKHFKDGFNYNVYKKSKTIHDSVIFKCDTCSTSYNPMEYSIQKYIFCNKRISRSKPNSSELPTAKMSDVALNSVVDLKEPVENEIKINKIKLDSPDDIVLDYDIKILSWYRQFLK